MGFDLAALVNDAVDHASASALVRGFLGNALLVALTITAMVAIAAFALYGPAVRAAGARSARALLWIFAGAAGMIFFNYRLTKIDLEKRAAQQGVRGVFDGIAQSRDQRGVAAGIIGGAASEADAHAAPAAGATGGGPSARADNLEAAPLVADVIVPRAF